MCGITHGGVRWNRCSLPTSGCIAGTTCTAVAPDPISATRLPVRSSPWSQRAVWNALPSKRSRPGSSGDHGSLRRPGAVTSTRAASGSPEVSSSQCWRSATQVAPSSSQLRRVWRSTSNRRAQSRRYSQDLVAHRVRGLPVVLRRERERVEVGRDVALRARVAVRPPGPAHVGAAFEQDEVLDARLLEADRHPEPAEAGAHDRDLVHVRLVHARNAIRAVSCAA